MPFIFHSDGKVWEVIPDLIALGVNALHPIEPKAMDINEVKARFGGKLALIGNIDMDILARGTPAAVKAQVRQRIQGLGAWRRIRGGRQPRHRLLRAAGELQRLARGRFRVWKLPYHLVSRKHDCPLPNPRRDGGSDSPLQRRVDAAMVKSSPSKEWVRRAVRRQGAARCPVRIRRLSFDVILRHGDGLADLFCEFPDDAVFLTAYDLFVGYQSPERPTASIPSKP